MSVNEAISAYSTNASGNTPIGTSNIGTDLDDHLRDVKKNIRVLSDVVSAATNQVFISADAANALFVSVGSTITIDDSLSGGGSFVSGVNISLQNASIATSNTATGRLVPTRIDQYGRVLNYRVITDFQATADDMASGIAQDAYVSPYNQGFGAPAAKGWIGFDGSGTVSSATSFLEFNVANCYRSAQGVYVVSWSNVFTTDRYPALVTIGNLGVSGNTLVPGSSTTTTTFFKFRLVTASSGAEQDCNRINVVAYGLWA